MTPTRRAGFALVLVSGLLAALWFLGIALLQLSHFRRTTSGTALMGIQAQAAAESALAYAAARLQGDPLSIADRGIVPDPANAGDDWARRGTDPSYARRDRRPSAHSGRLRGAGPAITGFSLRIRSADGLICINPTETSSSTVLLLDNLGAILDLSDTHPEPYAPNAVPLAARNALGEIQVSHLGRHFDKARPPGGYAGLDAARELLARFYSPGEVEAVIPFLSPRGESVPVPFKPPPSFEGASGSTGTRYKIWDEPYDSACFPCINFNAAPVEVIEAALRNLSHSGPGTQTSGFGMQTTGITDDFVRIRAAEARDMAEMLAENRPLHTWKRLLEVMAANDRWETDPLYADNQRLIKEGLVLAMWDANWAFPDPFTGRRNGLEVPRENPAAGFDATRANRCYKTGLGAASLNSQPLTFGSPLEVASGIGPRMSAVMSLAPPRRSYFFVEAEGQLRGNAEGPLAVRAASGEFSREERSLRFTSQQDFEPLLGVGHNPDRLTWPGDEAYVDVWAPSHEATRVGIQTRPHFPVSRWDGTTRILNYPPLPGQGQSYRYPPAAGWVGLSNRQWDPDYLAAGIPFLTPSDITFKLFYNEDPLTDPTSNSTYWDNLWDPDQPAPTSGVVPVASRGIFFSPDGPQTHTEAVPGAWSFPGCFGEGFFPADARGPQAGTIVCWFPVGVGHDQADPPPPSIWEMLYHPRPPLPSWTLFLGASISDNARNISLKCGVGPLQLVPDPVGNPSAQAEMSRTGWRCVAFAFERNGSGTDVSVYIDGTLCNPVPFQVPPIDPLGGRTMFLLPQGSRGADIAFFRQRLDQQQITALAAKKMYADSGRYVSPRVTFDTARLPEGVALTEFAWDGFIPEKTRGTMTLHASGYDGSGTRIADSPSVTWNGGSGAPLSLRFSPIEGCRQLDFTLEITTDPEAVDLIDSNGFVLVEDARILRETPILEEFRLFYTATNGRPRWLYVR